MNKVFFEGFDNEENSIFNGDIIVATYLNNDNYSLIAIKSPVDNHLYLHSLDNNLNIWSSEKFKEGENVSKVARLNDIIINNVIKAKSYDVIIRNIIK